MRYNVAQLIKGSTGASRQYELNDEIRNLDPDLEPQSPLVGSVRLLRTSQGVLVTGKLRTRLVMYCRRCLEPYEEDVEITLEEEFIPSVRIGESPIDAIPVTEVDEALLIDDNHILDLSEVVRQELWLAGTADGQCRPDCAGLCPQCGGNRNLGECTCGTAPADPRWAALQVLLSKETDSHERSD